MNKVWRIFANEYRRHVFRRRFVFALLSMPLLIVVVMGISIFSTELQSSTKPLGYVDHSGLLANPKPAPKAEGMFSKNIDIQAFPDEQSAKQALNAGQIQGYYVVSADYMQTSKVELVYYKQPAGDVQSRFVAFMRTNLLANQPPQIVQRIADGDSVYIQSADGSRTVGEGDIFSVLLPFITGILMMIVIITSGNYLLQAVVEEKENRTMEIVITSVTPEQLMTGKILGNIAVGLTQLLAWLLIIVIAIMIGRNQVDWLANTHIDPTYILIMVLTVIPSFVMIGALMAALGSSVTETREAQQLSGLFSLPVVAPYWLVYPIMTAPNGPLSLFLSFFPLTAPVTISLRAGFTTIPTAQLALNLLVLVISAAGAIWLAARAFRLGMLSYGKRLNLRQILRRAA